MTLWRYSPIEVNPKPSHGRYGICEDNGIPTLTIDGKAIADRHAANLRFDYGAYKRMAAMKVQFYTNILMLGFNVWACDAGIYIYIYICIYIYIYMCVSVCMPVCVYTFICLSICLFICLSIYVNIYIYIYIYIYQDAVNLRFDYGAYKLMAAMKVQFYTNTLMLGFNVWACDAGIFINLSI